MDRGNIFSGNAFKTTLYGTFVFLLILVLTGFVAHRFIEAQLLEDLHTQIDITAEVFVEDYEHEGATALTNLVERLTPQFERTHRLVALFDANGWRLAGSPLVHPDFTGSAVRKILTDPERDNPHRHFLVSYTLDDLTLIIGRDLGFVENVQRALVRTIVMIGAFMTLVFITIGYQMSRRMQDKLEVMGDILEQVAQGDTDARLPISPQNDQIDRVSKTMNRHLARLSDLMITTKSSAAAIAHDLKRPLSRALLGLNKVLDRDDLTEENREILEGSHQELHKLIGIFETMLRIARIDAGKGTGFAGSVNLTSLLIDMAETYEVVAEESGQTLVTDFDRDAEILVKGDAGMLGQMIANLLQNAVTHCPEGAIMTLGLTNQQGNVALSVSDNGPGIPSAIRQEVLTPFYRAERSRTTEGNGLGLSLVKSIAERHDATLTLSDNDPGLKITVTFSNAS